MPLTMPTATWEAWTPALARKVLDNHADPHARDIEPMYVDQLKRDMIADEWDDNGETVAFTGDGTCTDGHHRFTAIAEAGDDLPRGELWLLTVRGVAYDSRDTTNTGRPRGAADFVKMHDLGIEGIPNPHISALAYRIWLYRQGVPVRRADGISKGRLPKASPRELARVIKSDKLIPQALKRGQDLRRHAKIGTGSVNAFAYWMFSRVDDGMLEHLFWPGLLTGAQASRPLVVCRDRLIRAGKPSRRGVDAMNGDQMVYAMTMAWNAVGRDKTISEEKLLPANGVVTAKNFVEPLHPLPGKAAPRLLEVV